VSLGKRGGKDGIGRIDAVDLLIDLVRLADAAEPGELDIVESVDGGVERIGGNTVDNGLGTTGGPGHELQKLLLGGVIGTTDNAKRTGIKIRPGNHGGSEPDVATGIRVRECGNDGDITTDEIGLTVQPALLKRKDVTIRVVIDGILVVGLTAVHRLDGELIGDLGTHLGELLPHLVLVGSRGRFNGFEIFTDHGLLHHVGKIHGRVGFAGGWRPLGHSTAPGTAISLGGGGAGRIHGQRILGVRGEILFSGKIVLDKRVKTHRVKSWREIGLIGAGDSVHREASHGLAGGVRGIALIIFIERGGLERRVGLDLLASRGGVYLGIADRWIQRLRDDIGLCGIQQTGIDKLIGVVE